MRFILAFSSFFRLLFGGKLHPDAARYLPEAAVLALVAAEDTASKRELAPPEQPAAPASTGSPASAPASAPASGPSVTATLTDSVRGHQRDGALALLGILQREGRLVDFLQESIDDYEDVDIGAAVRDIHRGCRQMVADHFMLEPMMPGEENERVTVKPGFDPGEIRLIGEVTGDPPFSGILRHHGWRATKVKLPTLSNHVDRRVVAPAEVEVGG